MENKILTQLIQKGVKILNPETVMISEDVNPDRISSENVTIYPGCRIIGKKTLILKGSSIGNEAPVTLKNALIGENTTLNGGFFTDCVFAGNNTFGFNAHVRQGTILEEETSAAHTVGLKQTILFPFVTLGSLINFCDCFMSGGTSRKDHSEVGSSFVHFNYTPNQDKATPSMMGNIYQGILLNKKPIFLGGQGGIAGPVRLAFGCTTAAGSIIRKNQLKEDMLVFGGGFKDLSIPNQHFVYNNVKTIFNNNVYYIAGLIALTQWYKYVRPLFVRDSLSKALINGLQETLMECIKERSKRLSVFCDRLVTSKEILKNISKGKNTTALTQHKDAMNNFIITKDLFNKLLKKDTPGEIGEKAINAIESGIKKNGYHYIRVIQALSPDQQKLVENWLFKVENTIIRQIII
jgi:bifunctional UDP-N-acetylglucosamine pyrophosphorylase / glucosamine-1-phosphate N-acetyltransferase